jgi:hypothetical protein
MELLRLGMLLGNVVEHEVGWRKEGWEALEFSFTGGEFKGEG